MLNGKFFTGLPPKMIDRRGPATPQANRLESHFFWPDDSKVESATEVRVRRRNSMLDKPSPYGKQNSVLATQSNYNDDENNKKRFSKEFSQSSIQFFDNLNDTTDTQRRLSSRRASLLGKKMDIAEKPTKTKMEMPESIVDEAYTTAKKKQAYTSTIQFYDYVNDEDKQRQTPRNNLRKPKMDMNDKREMELNSKNSPKLQVKRDVRSLSEEKDAAFKNLNTLERSRESKPQNVSNSKTIVHEVRRASPKGMLRKEFNSFEKKYSSQQDLSYRPRSQQNQKTMEYDKRVQQRREPVRSLKEREPSPEYRREPSPPTFSRSPTNNYRRETGARDSDRYEKFRYNRDEIDHNEYYDDYRNNESYRDSEISPQRQRREPKSIIRNNTRNHHRDFDDFAEMNERVRNVRIRTPSPSPSPPPRSNRKASDNQRSSNYQRNDDDNESLISEHYTYNNAKKERIRQTTPTHSRSAINSYGGNTKKDNFNEAESPYRANEMKRNEMRESRQQEQLNNSYNNSRKLNNRPNLKLTTTNMVQSPVSEPLSPQSPQAACASRLQQSLRSSLCFNDGEIVASNSDTNSSAAKRKVRSMATQRVSVGLPD